MEFCTCKAPKVVKDQNDGKFPSCKACGRYWSPEMGSRIPGQPNEPKPIRVIRRLPRLVKRALGNKYQPDGIPARLVKAQRQADAGEAYL